MLFGSSGKLAKISDFNIAFNGDPIKRITEFKYLGVIFSENLSCSAHVEYTLCRAGKRLGMLRRIRDNLTAHCANTIYTSFIRPIVEYCSCVWGSCGSVNTSLLEQFQRRAARLVSRINDSDVALDYLRWPLLRTRHDQSIYKLVKKCLQGRCLQFF